jgi:SprT protein
MVRRSQPQPAPPPVPHAAWLEEWAAAWRVPSLPSTVRIEFSRRLRHALGKCTLRSGSIRLNAGLLGAAPEVIREVVCHEAAHAAAWMLHGESARPHGPEWKDLMRRAGYEPRVRWPAAAVPESVRRLDRAAILYVHACPDCRAYRLARRRFSAWRCARCRTAGREGRLEISVVRGGTAKQEG